MKRERQYESMRSDTAGFDRNFSDFVITRHKESWNAKRCTFFRDNKEDKKWAFCTFER